MQNKVVTTLSRGFVECGIASVRFNFRGVGASDGQFADTLGESEDALAVIQWVRRTRPEMPVWLAGFSFGAYIALRVANEANMAGLVTVAPASHLYDFSGIHLPACPWLVIQGEADEVVPVPEVRRWIAGLKRKPDALFLPDVGHFFHQRLDEIRNALSDFVPAHLGAGAEG